MSCPTLPFFSVGDRTIGVGLCKCKQNKLLFLIYRYHLILKSVAKTVIEGKVHKVTTVTDHILYPIGCKTHAIAINHTLSGIIHSVYGTDNTFKICKGDA